MRSISGWLALLAGMLVLGCNTVDPGDCWLNTSGGLGGGGPLPIGAGVGATTGGDFSSPQDSSAPPPSGPLDYGGGGNNPCVATPSQEDKSCQVDSKLLEHGATYLSCSDECRAKCSPAVRVTFTDFRPSDFPFVTTRPDDGSDKGGGWQVAKANLEFKKYHVFTLYITRWYCPFNIEMPLRTEVMGNVSAKRAANFSVKITEAVASRMDYTLPEGIFCAQFVTEVRSAFASTYKDLGAKVTK
jgi:hypothetical protein